jgi:phage head maturation protease
MAQRALQRAVETQKNRNTGTRELNGNLRAVEGEENTRKFTLSFSSEEPYMRWFGNEILDHKDGAIDMTRLTEMGVVLYNHNRDNVIGKVTRAWIEDGKGRAEIEFDSDDQSEVIRQKVESGTLKGVSVGYMVDSWEEVMPGKQSSDGRFTGPCSIARRWAPYEISIVSIPADTTVGVGREMEQVQERDLMETYARQLQYNKNLYKEETR